MNHKNLLTLLIVTCLSITSIAQDLKAIKKEVPLKGIKEVKSSTIAPHIYWYHTKSSKGLWDNQNKKVLLQNVMEAAPNEFVPDWLNYQTNDGYGIIDWGNARTLVNTKKQFTQVQAADKNLVILVGNSVLGFLFKDKGAIYSIPTTPYPDSSISFFSNENTLHSCGYDSAEHTMYWYGNEDDMIQDYISIRHLDDKYLIEDAGGYLNAHNVFSLDSGKLVKDFSNTIYKWEKGYYVYERGISYFDNSFNEILIEVPLDEHEVEDFQLLFDTLIDKASHVSDGIYKTRKKGLYSFFDIRKQKRVSGEYDYVFQIGADIYTKGYAYYLMHQGKIGIYNTWRGVELEPEFSLIEQRAFNNGGFGYRADDQLFPLGYGDIRIYELKEPIPWNESMEDSSIIIHHMSHKNGKLLLSLRHVEGDLHDYSYGTGNYYHMGSGVIDYEKQDWEVKSSYHTLTPYKGHYIAMSPGTSGHEWTKTELLNADFKPIDDKKWGVAFIYNGKLIIRNEDWQLVDYDIEKQKTNKVLGKWERQYEDWRLWDGHLFIGKNSYSKYDSEVGIDLMHIIAPGSELLSHPGFHWHSYIGNGLVMVGEIPKGKKLEDFQARNKRFDPNKKAIYDLRAKKLITPFFSTMFLSNYKGKNIQYYPGIKEGEDIIEVPLNEVRNHFK